MESTRDSVGKMLVFLYAFYISEIKSIFNLFATTAKKMNTRVSARSG